MYRALIYRPLFGFVALWIGMAAERVSAEEMKLPVVLSGGYETDPRDRGRPVVLVAAGLGVKPEVFREAFSGVRPSKNGPPSEDEARRNKQALMKVLGPLQVTNDRLDEVSNYYRYRRQAGEHWKSRPASAYAIVVDGKIQRVELSEAGAGYSSPPEAKVDGLDGVTLVVKLHFGQDLATNGSIETIEVAPSSASTKP